MAEIQKIVQAFGEAGKRAVKAGFDALEIHAAHGYLSMNSCHLYQTKELINTAGNRKQGEISQGSSRGSKEQCSRGYSHFHARFGNRLRGRRA